MIKRLAQGALALTILFAPALGVAAQQPKKPAALPTPNVPKVPLHTEFNVEVNKYGQVVRVKSGHGSKSEFFNAQTYGNVLQMWIRKEDGTAIVGMYHVTFDYDPHTKKVHRNATLISRGGSWGNQEGAANNMMDIVKREYLAGLKKQMDQQKQKENAAKNLPDINGIVKRDVKASKPSPSPSPSHKP